jgi:hypothetical protein
MFIMKPDEDDLHMIHFNCNNYRICILIIIFVLLVLFNLSIFWIKLNNNNKIKNKKY